MVLIIAVKKRAIYILLSLGFMVLSGTIDARAFKSLGQLMHAARRPVGWLYSLVDQTPQ